MASSPTPLAILDDYASIAPSHFTSILPSNRISLTTFPTTLPPTDHAALTARLHPFTIISTMRERTPFPAAVLSSLPNLKLLLTTGPRNAAIDLPAATAAGIIVTGTLGGGRSDGSSAQKRPRGYDATAEHTWALILGVTKSIARDDAVVKSGGWQSGLSMGLRGKKLGIVGLGRLGGSVARIGVLGFGMEVMAWSENLTAEKAAEVAEKNGLGREQIRAVGKEELFGTADVVSVHYVLSERSVGMVGEKELRGMKSGAVFVNTSRGPLVDEGALLAVLKEGRVKGAGLDVFNREPLEQESEWRSERWGEEGRSEVVLSPHMGYVEENTMRNWYDEQVENVERWLDGKEVLNRLN
ncbi:hypothetical protein MMC20_003993 [Loxospora ochrophaea]|nr:hypothetical protein [Loxospora ochrophaea]